MNTAIHEHRRGALELRRLRLLPRRNQDVLYRGIGAADGNQRRTQSLVRDVPGRTALRRSVSIC